MTMTEPEVDVRPAPVEQTEEVAAAAQQSVEQIPADDPRARAMWATIARTAMKNGADPYYQTIARELGAPSLESLKESGDINGTRSYRMRLFLNIKKSINDNGGELTGAEMRAYLKSVIKRSDAAILGIFEQRDITTDWLETPPETAAITIR